MKGYIYCWYINYAELWTQSRHLCMSTATLLHKPKHQPVKRLLTLFPLSHTNTKHQQRYIYKSCIQNLWKDSVRSVSLGLHFAGKKGFAKEARSERYTKPFIIPRSKISKAGVVGRATQSSHVAAAVTAPACADVVYARRMPNTWKFVIYIG